MDTLSPGFGGGVAHSSAPVKARLLGLNCRGTCVQAERSFCFTELRVKPMRQLPLVSEVL